VLIMSGIDATKYNIFVKVQGTEDTEYKGVGCALGYENLLHEGTKDLKGKQCADIQEDVDDNGKKLKKKKFDNGSITYTYLPTATDGRDVIKTAFDNEDEDVKLTIKLVLNDKGDGVSGTYSERDVLITAREVVPDDDELVEKVSMEFLNAPRKTDRVLS